MLAVSVPAKKNGSEYLCL